MLKELFGWFRAQNLETKIFAVVIVLALLARIFMLFAMADAPLTDSLHHLTIAKYIAENKEIPFSGIESAGINDMPVPFYHIIVALPFIILSMPFSFELARIFPFIFSFLQIVLSYLLLKRIFPKNWVFGLAFVAVQPFLMIYGSLNYLETMASVFALLCFYIYWRFLETGKDKFIYLMPFALAGLALSKESATFLVPAFFLAFLYGLWKRKPGDLNKGLLSKQFKSSREWLSKTAYFAIASIVLASSWFIITFFATGKLSSGVNSGLRGLSRAAGTTVLSLDGLFLLPLNFNSAFWFFMSQDFGNIIPGISADFVLAGLSIATFPILVLLGYGLVKGVKKREKYSTLLLFIIILALVLLWSRGNKFLHVRLIVPMLPLLGIAFSSAFKELKQPNWRKLLTFLFVLTALYSIAFSSVYAFHFGSTYSDHLPLYNFVKELPEGSAIAIQSNKARQISLISGKRDLPFEYFKGMDREGLKAGLDEYNATHLALTCYKDPWDKGIIGELEEEGFLLEIFKDSCSTLYKINR